MIYFLRNISIRLCISVLISIPATFICFPTIKELIPSLNITIFSITSITFILIITGYIMNMIGQRSIYKYINEAKSWERDGIFHKSEACYLKALELFDSYLLTILNSKKVSPILTGAIAKFSLTAGRHNDNFDRSATFFLLKNPQEGEVAYLWLKNFIEQKNKNGVKEKPITEEEENLVTLLAEQEPLNQQLVPLLAEIFTKTQRSDFAAKRVFSFIDRDVECFETPQKLDNIKISQVRKISKRVNNIALFRRLAINDLAIKEGVIWVFSIPMHLISFIIEIVEWIVHNLLTIPFKRIYRAIALHPAFGNNLKRFAITILITGFVILSINTIFHLLKTPPPPTSPPPKTVAEDDEIQVVPQKKFTIQIAAYLVKSHAEKYLSNFEKKGGDGGYITEVEGGGKIWYLIRVGKYETKERAAEHGNKLKSQGIIKDFFVDNKSG
ncbi:MAG: SPOR domain-containing protein [Desulfamplus sp.]|nr:SPOR domain-containing protein [Desulfamplus sp.]